MPQPEGKPGRVVGEQGRQGRASAVAGRLNDEGLPSGRGMIGLRQVDEMALWMYQPMRTSLSHTRISPCHK